MKMNTNRSGKSLVVLAAAALLFTGGAVLAQTGKDTPKPKAPVSAPARGTGPMMGSPGMGGPGMGMGGTGMGMDGSGMGMMGGPGMGGMGMGMCPAMGGVDTKIDVKKIAKGVTITLTSDDARSVARIQKMAEAMRLMHEAASE